jgi:acetolactate synthase-1/3 small subunit
MHIQEEYIERHVLSLTVTNEAGILARIAGLFTARGYNIDSLTVADISPDHAISRITIVTNGPPKVIDQIIAQLDRLVPVHKVTDLADVFRAKVVDTTIESFIFEITGTTEKIDNFVGLMRQIGLVEVGRTGVVGLIRGKEAN